MRRGLTARLVVATAGLAIIVTISFSVLLLGLREERRASARVAESNRVIAAAHELERLVVDLETGQRGFIITGDERFLEPWRDARVALPPAIRSLEAAAIVPQQDARAHRIGDTVGSYLSDYSVPLVEAARRGDLSASSAAVTDQGRQLVDTLRAEFDQLLDTESAISAGRRRRAEQAARWASRSATGGLVASVVIVLGYGAYLIRSMVVPLRSASGMAGRLAAGELSVRMPETGTAEIGALQHSFNAMATSLEEHRDELQRVLAQQAALRRVATLVASGVVPAEVFNAVCAEVADLLGADATWLLRYEDDRVARFVATHGDHAVARPVGTHLSLEGSNVALLVLSTGEPARLDLGPASGPAADRLRAAKMHTVVGGPVLVAGRPWGVVVAAWIQPEAVPTDAEDRIVEFTELVATAVDNADRRAELVASRARVVAAADDARRRIERDLHDGVQQRLISLGLELRATEAALPPGLDAVKAQLEQTGRGLTGVVEELQEVSRGIHPAILSRGGLGPAVKTLARRSTLLVEVSLRGDRRLPEAVEVAAYYVVSEALTNAAKHAHASVVTVDLQIEARSLRLSVRDDGVGGADERLGSGLVGLRDRVEAVGGTIEVTSGSGSGTAISVVMPLDD